MLVAECVALLAGLAAVSAATSQSRPQSTVMHPAFKNAGSTSGLQIWRIVSFEPQPVDPKDFGKFHEGDSYIVLSTKEDKSKKGSFSWDIHYWLGSKTSQDESGAAAILSVELDDGLGGGPVQHREVQEHESQQFLGYFKPSGVRYVPGGAASGFQHVEINAAGEKKLYQVKGKKNIRVKQVAPDVKSMNKGDCFILDGGRDIFVWVGPKAKGTERLKAISAANQIRDQDHAGRARVHVVDSSSTEVEVQKFFSELGSGSPSQVSKEAATDDDQEFERNVEATATLYKVSDASGKLVSEKIAQKPLKQSMLKSEDCFILDTVTSGIYVWVGRGSTTQEKVKALEQGQAFLAANKYPAWTKMQRIVQDAEPSAFREYFSEWRDSQFTGGLGKGGGRVGRSKREGQAKDFMPDEGTGVVEVWRVERMKLAPVEADKQGIFFAGDSYLVKYSYRTDKGDKYILYFWQGKDSSNDEKAVSALEAMRMDNELGGRAIQVRVEQGQEPAHFLQLFKGKMIILLGGRMSGFKNIRDYDSYDTDGTRLFQIVGTNKRNVRAIQVAEVAASLDTNDVFLLETPSKAYLWIGAESNKEEEEMGEAVRRRLCPDREIERVKEGEEPAELWAALGGRGEYKREREEGKEVDLEPRLYHCFMAGPQEKLKVEQISEIRQEEMYPDDIMILDTGDVVYLWVGKDASVEEKRDSYKLAQSYLHKRSRENNVIISVKQGEEPLRFINYFEDWNDNFWNTIKSFDEVKSDLNDINNSIELD